MLKNLLLSFVEATKEHFIKSFGYDKNKFVEDNFSFKLIYSDLLLPQDVSKYLSYGLN